MRPVIHTEKHVVQNSLFAIASGAIAALTFIVGKQSPTATTAAHVREGSTISAIYIEMWVSSDDAGSGTVIATLERRPSGLGAMSTTESASLDSYDNKKNVLHTFMGLVPNNVDYPMAIIKGWFKIPKGKQRFGIEDSLVLNIFGQSNGVSACGFATYKEQY